MYVYINSPVHLYVHMFLSEYVRARMYLVIQIWAIAISNVNPNYRKKIDHSW